MTSQPRRISIVGVPNCGKSLVFSRLTRTYSASTNYPYTTTETRQEQVEVAGEEYFVIDTPGILGLDFGSEEEQPTRELLESGSLDAIIQCVDAGNLFRSMTLTAQLAEFEIPAVICLTMLDEAASKGLFIDTDRLSQTMGVPVIPVCALDGRGIDRLGTRLAEAQKLHQVEFPGFLQNKLDTLDGGTRAERFATVKGNGHLDLMAGQSLPHMRLEAHKHWAEGLVDGVVKPTGLEPRNSGWNTIGRFALHPVGAWIFLLLTVVVVYLLVAELGAKFLVGHIDRLFLVPVVEWIGAVLGPGHVHDILIGEYGLLTLGLFNAIGTVLPILTLFYLLYGFLEDIGYFPLLSVQFDRLLSTMGLNGNAVLPISLGF